MIDTMADVPIAIELAKQAEALVCDDRHYDKFKDIDQIPRFAIGGDLHAFREDDAHQRIDMADWSTYTLSFAAFCNRERTPYPYKWPPQKVFDKLLFLPNSVRDEPILGITQEINVGLGGECSPIVYPFRAMCARFPEVTKIPYLEKKHGEFLKELARYRVGITCTSIIGYNIAKYVEIPWAGSLLFAERPCEEEMFFLGYDETNAVLISKEDAQDPAKVRAKLIEVLGSWWEHHLGVAQAGQELVGKRHRVWHRLQYIANLVDRINRGGFKTIDQFQAFQDAIAAYPKQE